MALSVLPTITEDLEESKFFPTLNQSNSHTQLKSRLEVAEDEIFHGPYGDTYKLYRQLNYTVNRTINLKEDCKDKLELLRNLQLVLSQEPKVDVVSNKKEYKIDLKISCPFLKVNPKQGHISITRNVRSMLWFGDINVANCIINEIIALCDKHFFHGYVVPMYKLLIGKAPINWVGVIPDPFLQIYLECFVKICTQIITSLQRVSRRRRQYLSQYISAELELISELRNEIWIMELIGIEN